MRLPNLECAACEQGKIQDYLLNLNHPQGWGKAKYFLGLGFSVEAWQAFGRALVAHAECNEVVKQDQNDYGTLYVVDCNFSAANGTQPCIRTVWEITTDNPCPRLITAHPNG
ncbi:MAG: hypothetical protein H6935_04945 [Thiobacillus sp.]|nr:hypothetical protein [Thiobacillus sp.]